MVVRGQLILKTIRQYLDDTEATAWLMWWLTNPKRFSRKAMTNKMLPKVFRRSKGINSKIVELPLVLKMSTGLQNHLEYDYFEEDDDSDSVASAESEDFDYPVERIIAEFTGKNGRIWFLVKWQRCPLVRSSWECGSIFFEIPWVLDEWKVEKQRQAEGKSKPLDIVAFNKAVLDVEIAERQRRRLRSFRKQAQNILKAITAS